MSSRNLRLNLAERETAAGLHQVLVSIKKNLDGNSFLPLKNKAIKDLENKNFKVEYLELAKTNNLEIVSDFKNKEDLIILVAAFLNDVRLIDNLLINP